MLTSSLFLVIIILCECKYIYSKDVEIKLGAKFDVCCGLKTTDELSLHMSKGTTRLAVLYKDTLSEADLLTFVKDNPDFKVEKRDSTICLIKGEASKQEENLEITCKLLIGTFGSTKSTEVLRIKIFEELKFMSTLPDVKQTAVGESFSLECEASGSPDLKVLWRKENQGVISEGSSSATLNIKDVNSSMNGDKYTCEASISIPKDSPTAMIKHTLILNVSFQPEIEVQLNAYHTDLGTKEVIQVTVKGNPRPVLDCRLLNIAVDRIITISEPNPTTYVYQMVFENVTINHIGDYKCKATNAIGEIEKMVSLILGPINLRIISTNETSYADYYKLTWQVESKASISLSKIIIDDYEGGIGSATQQRVLKETDLSPVMQVMGSSDNNWRYQYSHNVMNLTSNKLHKISLQMCRQEQCIDSENSVYVQTPVFSGSNNVPPSEIMAAQKAGSYNPNGGHMVMAQVKTLCVSGVHLIIMALLPHW